MIRSLYFLCIALLGVCNLCAQENDISVHDPVMLKQDGVFYLFSTGHGIAVWSSTDMKNWTQQAPVFAEAPPWAVAAVPGFQNHIWAPDISFYKGMYYLYYSVSAFGKNTSCIGLAINKTLNPNSPDFKWIDQGKIIQSYPGKTTWNAIDPNLVLDNDNNPYLSFGSFWDGIKIIPLHADGKSVKGDTLRLKTIASRRYGGAKLLAVDNNPPDAGGNAIEAPFILKKDRWYYLFASIDYCCKGVNSTYKMIVGRSLKLTGPYTDAAGKPMEDGGGTVLLAGDQRWHGVGHNAVCLFDGQYYLVFHAYDGQQNGFPKLQIRKLKWTKNNWPIVAVQ